MEITINNKSYNVEEAITKEQKEKGLQNRDLLDKDKGMIFYYDIPQTVSFWMKNVKIPLDIIFINDDQEVIKVAKGIPNSKKAIICENVSYVLELNTNSGVQPGDQIEFDEDTPVMKILGPDGKIQGNLWGGERIFSRTNTKILIKKAKKAEKTKSDSDYKSLGKYLFKCIKQQDERDPEYVQIKN